MANEPTERTVEAAPDMAAFTFGTQASALNAPTGAG